MYGVTDRQVKNAIAELRQVQQHGPGRLSTLRACGRPPGSDGGGDHSPQFGNVIVARRQKVRHPSPAQALEALSDGLFMYAPISGCSKRGVAAVGLRDNEDRNAVLICAAHFGRLRQMPINQLAQLERVLLANFTC